MNRLTKRYNENVGMYEYVDAFSGAGIFDSILKGLTSKFVKDTATKLGTKALEAGVNKVGSEIGTRAANKVISTVDNKFFKPNPVIITKPLINEIIEKPLGNVIMKELNKKTNDKSNDDDYNAKKQYYGYGYKPLGYKPLDYKNKQFQDKLNKLLK
mgnify:CR=1 FL=1